MDITAHDKIKDLENELKKLKEEHFKEIEKLKDDIAHLKSALCFPAKKEVRIGQDSSLNSLDRRMKKQQEENKKKSK